MATCTYLLFPFEQNRFHPYFWGCWVTWQHWIQSQGNLMELMSVSVRAEFAPGERWRWKNCKLNYRELSLPYSLPTGRTVCVVLFCVAFLLGLFPFFFFLIHTDFRSNLNPIYRTTEFSFTSKKVASVETKNFPLINYSRCCLSHSSVLAQKCCCPSSCWGLIPAENCMAKQAFFFTACEYWLAKSD